MRRRVSRSHVFGLGPITKAEADKEELFLTHGVPLGESRY